jgi:phosphoglycerate dehydrogenase-like enzyme
LRRSRLVIVVAGATSQNQGFLGEREFASMQKGSGLVLVSRAAVVDFDAMLDCGERGHIRFATDVFPQEPLPASHRARRNRNSILCAHQAGGLEAAIKQMGKLVVGDAELIAHGLPPILCKSAQPETVKLLRSKPIDKS